MTLMAIRAHIPLLFMVSVLIMPIKSVTVPWNRRVDCYPSPGASENLCNRYNCIWDATTPKGYNAPWCYLNPERGYQESESTDDGTVLTVDPGIKIPYGDLLSPLHFKTLTYGKAVNIRITTANGKPRYEPPIPMPRNEITSTDSLIVKIIKTAPFSFTVTRASTGTALWNTSIGGLLFADQYLQIATYLPTYRIYGFGENLHLTLMHNLSEYRTWPMLARDEPPHVDNPYLNLYGVQPFYMCLENDGKAHGVVIYNSNPQEVTLGPAPQLIYRTIGGILDITFFPGPSPEDVIRQYTTYIGKPSLPAYFALGFQLSRYGYKDLQEMEDDVTRVQKYGIPLDITYADIDYMHRFEDFTLGEKWQNFPNYAKKLHDEGLYLFLIFDPAIQINYQAFTNALNKKAAFIEWQSLADVQKEIYYYPYYNATAYEYVNGTKVMLAVVWPDWYVAFPDFLVNNTVEWWVDEIKAFHEKVPLDGIWIDMNEPAAFGTNEEKPWYFGVKPVNITPLYCPQTNRWDDAPYKTHSVYNWGPNSYLCTKTLCMNATTGDGKYLFYDTKNLYGLTETIATAYALANMTHKRGGVITRSTFVSSGHYGGHWLGDNTSGWKYLQTSIIGTLEFNMFGIPYIGADICGFNGNTTEQLCLRWSQLGAFYPFSRNHNANNAIPQDPAEWPSVAHAARQALLFRYHYLPYLYTLMFSSSRYGGTVVRPLFFEFPTDQQTYQLNYQFMWGSAMAVLPVVYENAESVHGYLPNSTDWYSLRDSDYGRKASGGWETFSAPQDDMIPVFVRAGSILPRQKPETTTTASRLNPFELLIAPDRSEAGSSSQATGMLYWDDGISLVSDIEQYNFYQWSFQYVATASHAALLILSGHSAKDLQIPSLDIIDIVGYPYCADMFNAMINGRRLEIGRGSVEQSPGRLHINISNLINLATDQVVLMNWTHGFCETIIPSVPPYGTTTAQTVESTTRSAVSIKQDIPVLATAFIITSVLHYLSLFR